MTATDLALHVRFTSNKVGTSVYATRGFNGPIIARLVFVRDLSTREQQELDMAFRSGEMEARQQQLEALGASLCEVATCKNYAEPGDMFCHDHFWRRIPYRP